MRRRGRCAAVLALCVIAMACHDDGVRVASLDFTGVRAVSESDLRRVMRTRQASPWPWARWRAFEAEVFEQDLDRLRAWYRDRGYDQALVRAASVDLSPDGQEVRLVIAVEEGSPVQVAALTFAGLEDLPAEVDARVRAQGDGLVGRPRDVARLAQLREGMLTVLRDHGRPHATVDLVETDGPASRTVTIEARTEAGPETRFGQFQMNGLERTKQVVLRRAVTFKPGDLYRESAVLTSQRRLRQIGAFEFAHLAPEAAARDAHADVLPMIATVAEARPHRFEVGVGYGTEDRFRGSFEWRNVNFYGNGSQWIGTARYSTVTRGAGFGYDHPYLLPSGGTLDARAGAWWTTERSFTSNWAGGQLGMSHAFGRRDTGTARLRYRFERLSYRVTDATLRFDERAALGLDPETGRGDGTVAGVEVLLQETRVDRLADPTRGAALALTFEHVAPWLGSRFRYDELGAEARAYVSAGSRVTLGLRARYGTLASADEAEVPFAERFFLGGSTHMRGWGRYEVGPTSEAGVPIGGRSVLDGSAELRLRVCCGIGVVAFADAGNVWASDWTLDVGDLRRAVGGGLRYDTLVGVARLDVGYQLTPISRLRIDGKPQSRRWRLHLSIGHAF